MNRLDEARFYVKMGWSVIPLKKGSKIPAISSWKEYQSRLPTDEELQEWFDNDKGYNIAIITGPLSMLTVVDFDSMEAYRKALENGFPVTPLVKTARGVHAFCKYEPGYRCCKPSPDVDFKADGGYVVAPSSIHPSGVVYKWVEGAGLDDLPLGEVPKWLLAENHQEKQPLGEIFKGVPDGERNESLTKVAGSVIGKGFTFDEALQFCRTWNLQCDPPVEDEVIVTTVKSIWKKDQRGRADIQDDEQPSAIYRNFADIEAKPINWLWEGRIARGKLSMLAGNPGLGKSQVTASMAAIVSTGGLWPVDRTQCEAGNVIIISAEDDAEDTIRPRLEAAGADLSRIYILDAVEVNGEERSFNLKDNLLHLQAMIREIGNVAMIIIDPMSAYLGGGTDGYKESDIRALLHPLGQLAAHHGVAVVFVSHLNKAAGREAMHRVNGSLGFVAAVRSAWLVTKDPSDPTRRLFLPMKNNIGNDQAGLAFRIESRDLPGGIHTSCVSWENETVSITADEAMQPPGDPEGRSSLEDATDFLCTILADGPLTQKEVEKAAREAGHSWTTIRRAKKALGVKADKGSHEGGGVWKWQLPNQGDHHPLLGFHGHLGHLGHLGDESPVQDSLDFDESQPEKEWGNQNEK